METNVKEIAQAIMAMRNGYRQARKKDEPRSNSRALEIDRMRGEKALKELEDGTNDDFELRGVNLLEPGTCLPQSTRNKLVANASVSKYKNFTTQK